MLQQNAVSSAALELLKIICTINELEAFGLGGGTSLALRMGHRVSINLDFFTNTNFNTSLVFQIITKKFLSAELLFEQNQTMVFSINDIKVDFVLYPFPWLHPFEVTEGIRLLSIEDIIPMKLQAVSNRNAKKNYCCDIAKIELAESEQVTIKERISALLKDYPLTEMLKVFASKFPQIDVGFIIHSLTDFEKADTELDSDTNDDEITWVKIKTQLTNAVKRYTTSLL